MKRKTNFENKPPILNDVQTTHQIYTYSVNCFRKKNRQKFHPHNSNGYI